MTLFEDTSKGAALSDDGRYRYQLTRRWREGTFSTALVFVMLNPSTADASVDDNTIRRCVGFAKREGFWGITVVNLYAFRATDPSQLRVVADPVGPDNDEWLAHTFGTHSHVVCAWGVHGSPDRVDRVRSIIADLNQHASRNVTMCLGRTKGGSPRHPLYVAADTPLEEYL